MLFPYVFAALRVSYGVGWKVSLVAELFGANAGLGYVLNLARQNFDTPLILAAVLCIILLVFVVDKVVFQTLDRAISRWR